MRGCLTCRQRHLKCDKTGTECLRCQRSGRQCIPAPAKPEEVAFRHGQNPSMRSEGPPRYGESDLSFPEDQVWIDVPTQLCFEDETEQTASDYHVVSAEASPTVPRGMRKARLSTSTSTIPSIPSPTQAFLPPGGARRISNPRTLSLDSLMPPDTPRDNPKLADFNEAFLLRHFQRTLGPWLDSCDHERQFSMDVVERAPSYPLLLYACLATAARHLSRTTNLVPPNTADEYHEKCIAILLPGLANWESGIGLDILLASTVILRFFEQISSSQNPLRLELSAFDERLQMMWTQQESQTDRDWAHRAVWLLAGAINYCYGVHDPQGSAAERTFLKHRINAWEARKPDGFRPLHFSLADPRIGRPYPVIWFTKSLYVSKRRAAYLHGKGSDKGVRASQFDDVAKYLGILFGIALSSDGDPSARVMACHALCACSSWVREPLARRCLLDLLRKTEAENGWPWAFMSERLTQEWRIAAS
ncbi:hypothetical protein AN9141.2 [Aspergillus nidulans FGSC A4]|uniref:Zn(II)2Cys6 transcription factor (Eurofung) n=1 Tax=Emericella nidulans (strain FGSC A4 / ATCC 38163 / CBS 112.46 / NRRL 194 / M139) TaxID=227321 RepID=Q5ARD9_EMENI|nr:hypothetical protein [Aspergillus nidulans FGSC A4]EAA61974.1 hypothetical protein AN9141.2 [Aspergillus nidulans FGSC A4]CBF82466.1 TPA: Putative Zn(II)2Cys6 transcription factor (Eurofung) [Aspergillus nidulans FGSC A4]|eukprot:XP_682410.1 hypothetical protein AN9141.2 [Aspergillus nidulans FGSC A4]